eukprot:TRINITY_DN10752_c0_g1_i1.p1 TRINITY_DN10752_c0_g1~~TRINITY_DN10752_c0_g1_i1.p1  ORF type:complete len:419 (-),score=198.00 TRINITY_DN10752_c0_g1_i1:112-1320(-)
MSQQTSIKVFFNNEIRRVSLASASPSLEQLRTQLRSLFAGQFHDELTIQYIDEDDDRITVSSEIEWTEALRSMEAHPVKKIHVVSNKMGGFFKDGPAPKPLFFYEDKNGGAKACKKNRIGADKQTRSLHKLRKAVPKCLEKLFDGGKILPHNIPEWMQSVVRVNVVSAGGEGSEEVVDLDVDIHRLGCLLHRRSLALLDSQDYTQARRVLKALLALDPTSPLALYNLACTNSLDAKPKAACKNLAKAVDCGYTNLGHLLRDSDLDSIRLLPEYLRVVDSLRGQSASGSDSDKSEPAEPAKAPEVAHLPQIQEELEQLSIQEESESEPEPEPVHEDKSASEAEKPVEAEKSVEAEQKPEHESSVYEKELQVLKDMGFEDQERNLALLVAENGDLATVVTLLFE